METVPLKVRRKTRKDLGLPLQMVAHVGAVIKNMRVRVQMPQAKLAGKMGVLPHNLSALENSKAQGVKFYTLVAVCGATGGKLSEFVREV